jgi:hypothetical protein
VNFGSKNDLLARCSWKATWLSVCVLLCAFVAAGQSQQGATGNKQADPQAAGSIRGKIIDQTGVSIGGAHVKLSRDAEPAGQEVVSDEDGQFFFANVPPGPFQINISSEGLASQDFSGAVEPGEACVTPVIMLAVATQVTEVRVGLTQQEIAQDQIKDQEKQRVLGIIPNFYVSYVPNAAPLTSKQKFELAWKSTVDPITFVGVGALAGAYHATNRWKDYGQGAQGYAKRYGAEYANVAAGTFIGGAVLPSLLKQDPRYFYRGTGSKKSRLLYALSSAFICKGDNGQWQPNYSNVGGYFAAGGLSYLYYPANDRHGASLLVSSVLIRLGETTAASIFQEFVVPRFTPNLPTRAPSQP